MNSSTAPVYQSECSPANTRGMLLTLQGTTTIFGLCVGECFIPWRYMNLLTNRIAYWLDYGTSFTESTFQWKFPLVFQAVFAIFLILQVIGLPETPRWLMQNDRHEEAREVVAAIADAPLHDEQVSQTLLDIKRAIRDDTEGGPLKLKEFWSHGRLQNWRRMLIIILIEIMQQFTGSNMMCVTLTRLYTVRLTQAATTMHPRSTKAP